MFDLDEFLSVAVLPNDQDAAWLEGAHTAIDYLLENARSDEIILYANVRHALTLSTLVPLAGLAFPENEALKEAPLDAYAQWTLAHVSGGGEPDRMYLSPPIDSSHFKSLEGAEQLVFRRTFSGVDKGPPRTELSQPWVQALDLYWLDEESAFCELDDDGDVQPVIRLRDLSARTGETGAMLVTIKSEALHRYMAVTQTALITRFDFTRYIPGSFGGWNEPSRDEVEKEDLCYQGGVQPQGSFVNGGLLLRPILTPAMLIAKARRDWQQTDKQYATFKAFDWRHGKTDEISCAPSALTSYFATDLPLPFQTTPAFFRPDVLQKYKSDPDKYQLEHRIDPRSRWLVPQNVRRERGRTGSYLSLLSFRSAVQGAALLAILQ